MFVLFPLKVHTSILGCSASQNSSAPVFYLISTSGGARPSPVPGLLLTPRGQSAPAPEGMATELPLRALGSGVRLGGSLGSPGLLPFLSSVLTRP